MRDYVRNGAVAFADGAQRALGRSPRDLADYARAAAAGCGAPPPQLPSRNDGRFIEPTPAAAPVKAGRREALRAALTR